MVNDITWSNVAIRLLLVILASALIGFDRESTSRPAGLRTVLLVGLAAAISMIQVNLLLPVRGKVPDSYVVMDLMRLPLGILSGMGFIGAGAILRKDDRVAGVTTAATLWFVTVMGLCFGGGQIKLGIAATFIGIGVLRGLRWLEQRWLHQQSASLNLTTSVEGPDEQELSSLLKNNGFRLERCSVSYLKSSGERKLSCEVHWQGLSADQESPVFLKDLLQRNGVQELSWHRQGTKPD